MRSWVPTILRKQMPHDAGTQSWDCGSGAHECSICGTYTYIYTVYLSVYTLLYMCTMCYPVVAHACAYMHMFVVRSVVEDLHMHNLWMSCSKKNIMFRIIGPDITLTIYLNQPWDILYCHDAYMHTSGALNYYHDILYICTSTSSMYTCTFPPHNWINVDGKSN